MLPGKVYLQQGIETLTWLWNVNSNSVKNLVVGLDWKPKKHFKQIHLSWCEVETC